MSQPITISVPDIADSPFCVATEDGLRLFDAIKSALNQQQHVVLSFAGVDSLSSAFLNAAIGQLYHDFDEERIRTALSVSDMARTDQLLLKRVVDNAKRYYSDPQKYTAALDHVMEGA